MTACARMDGRVYRAAVVLLVLVSLFLMMRANAAPSFPPKHASAFMYAETPSATEIRDR